MGWMIGAAAGLAGLGGIFVAQDLHELSRPLAAAQTAPARIEPRRPPPVFIPTPTRIPDEDGAARPSGPCLPDAIADGARIIALGAYEGATKTRYAVPGQPHEVDTIAVGASRSGPPVVLIVSAYESIVWDLRAIPRQRLRAVIAYGYYHQAVVGVANGVPVRFAARRAGSVCGDGAYAYKGGRDLERLDRAVREATGGRAIDDFQGDYSPVAFHLDRGAPPSPDASIEPRLLRSGQPFVLEDLAPREEGMAQLVAQGAIRPANRADIDALSAAMTRSSPTGHLAPVHARIHDGYVVLRKIHVPRGMYGAHSATFLVPRGVPMPEDHGSHNSYYDLVTGRCARGAMCHGSD